MRPLAAGALLAAALIFLIPGPAPRLAAGSDLPANAPSPIPASSPVSRYFAIEVVDEQTGRGVPLVELRTVANVRYYTDSAGLAGIDDPVLMGRNAFFYVASAGYEFPADGFGFHGTRLDLAAGGSARLKIKRTNIAQRLYRTTGEGTYRDTVLLGRPAPVRQPLLDAQVTGQDSVQAAVYRGKLYWFYGDTFRPGYPLGHFQTAGATSALPADGGLDPSDGVNLDYFTGRDGFSRGVLAKDKAPAWLDGLLTVTDAAGRERMVARSSLMKDVGHCVGRRLVVWNDAPADKAGFETLKEIPLDAPLAPIGHPVRVDEDGTAYFYFGDSCPNMRCKADWKAIQDLESYEGFSCLVPGSHNAGADAKLDRDAAGRLVWGWKRDTAVPGPRSLASLVRAGKLRQDEIWFRPLDAQTRKPVNLASGSVAYNPFRRCWVMIAVELGGKTELGEVWYAEAEKPHGPWPWARKIVTHDHYSFYNPAHHPFFDQQDGKIIYFEGTYSTTFSGNDNPTPRYDYNQVMYRLDLSDPRLTVPSDPPPPNRP